MNIVFLGCTQNYGYNFSAANTKTELLARGLNEQGCSCTIINSVIGKKLSSNQECINKEFCKVFSFKKHGNQFISWIYNTIPLFKLLKTVKRTDGNILVLEFPDFHLFLLYVFLGWLLHYHIAVIAHEWGPTVKGIHPLRKPSTWLYSKTFGYLVDGILPISEYIIEKTRHFKKPYIKVPVLADFNMLSGIDIESKRNVADFFLYCVYAAYTRVIFKVIDAFAKSKANVNFEDKLVLVLAGSDAQVKKVADYIVAKKMEHEILIKRKLPYKELLRLYSDAIALIIPLDPDSEQDKARFSQKIAEYTSSKTPIITNWVGEIPYYFHQGKDVVIAQDYSEKGFSDVFLWCLSHKQELLEIGYQGYQIGKENFNYKKMGIELFNFFKTL